MPKLTQAVLLAALCASPAFAADTKTNRPKVYTDIVACRAVVAATARLACFDAATKALEEATDNPQILMLAQTDVHKTKKH